MHGYQAVLWGLLERGGVNALLFGRVVGVLGEKMQ